MRQGKNLCYVVETDGHFSTFKIVGKGGAMVPVSRIHTTDPAMAAIENDNAWKAIQNWFSSPPFQEEYNTRASIGQRDPHQTWEKICRYYKLKREYEETLR